jgi:hypothetical protein
MELEEFLELTRRKGVDFQEKKERENHMKRIYNYAKEIGIADKLTSEDVKLIKESYDIKQRDEDIAHFEKYH